LTTAASIGPIFLIINTTDDVYAHIMWETQGQVVTHSTSQWISSQIPIT